MTSTIIWTSIITALITTIFIKAPEKYFDYLNKKDFNRETKKLELLGDLMGTAELLAYYHCQRESSHLACNYYEYCWKNNESKAFYEKHIDYEITRMDQLAIEFANTKKSYINCLFQIQKVFLMDKDIKKMINDLTNLKLPLIKDRNISSKEVMDSLEIEISKRTEEYIIQPSKNLYEKLSNSWNY